MSGRTGDDRSPVGMQTDPKGRHTVPRYARELRVDDVIWFVVDDEYVSFVVREKNFGTDEIGVLLESEDHPGNRQYVGFRPNRALRTHRPTAERRTTHVAPAPVGEVICVCKVPKNPTPMGGCAKCHHPVVSMMTPENQASFRAKFGPTPQEAANA